MNTNTEILSPLETELVQFYTDRFRIFLILYVFSELLESPQNDWVRLFKSEIKIQKLDFLVRNPDYFAYELLRLADSGPTARKIEIKQIVKGIFESEEPNIRREEMERFFFGAYEDIDNIISFLHSHNLIFFDSKKDRAEKVIQKKYYITRIGEQKFKDFLESSESVKWHWDRAKVIKKYFGSLLGSQLAVNQYEISEYRDTPWGEYIEGIEGKAKSLFENIFGEKL